MSAPQNATAEKVYIEHAAYGAPEDIAAAVEALFCTLPAASRLGAGTKVLVKPNLLAKHAPEKAVTTHPDVLRGVLLALQKRGVTDVVVADSPGGPYTPGGMRSIYKGCGLAEVCEAFGAEAYTACESGPRKTEGALVKEFTLIRPVLQADFIINLPKLKTHVLTLMSGAVKNLFGTIPGLQKAEFHTRFPQKQHFAGMLVDLCETVRADMHIVDGVLGMEGDGPGSGSPRPCNLLFAGEDPYLIDLALCHAMGMRAMDAPVLKAAHERGLCPAALPAGTLVGEAEKLLPLPGFAAPRSYTGSMDFGGDLPAFLQPLVRAGSAAVAPKPHVHKSQCIGCGKCAEICPQQVITLQNGKAHIARRACIRCFCCHEICPVHAIGLRRLALFKI